MASVALTAVISLTQEFIAVFISFLHLVTGKSLFLSKEFHYHHLIVNYVFLFFFLKIETSGHWMYEAIAPKS